MVKGGRILLVAAMTASCGRVPAVSAPADSWSPHTVGPFVPLASVLDTGGSASQSDPFKALTDQIQKFDSSHKGAFSALIWTDIKDKTQQDLLLQGRQWQKDPQLQIQYLQGLVTQVQALSSQQADQLAQTLPAGALESASMSPTAQTQVPPAQKPAYDALGKRVKALPSDRAQALVGLIWKDTKDMTTQQLWAERQDWKAHPDKQLAYLTKTVTTLEQADDATVKSLISDTPPEVLEAAKQAAKQAQGDQNASANG